MNIQSQERDILLNEGYAKIIRKLSETELPRKSFLKGIKSVIFILLKNFRDNLGEIFLPLNF